MRTHDWLAPLDLLDVVKLCLALFAKVKNVSPAASSILKLRFTYYVSREKRLSATCMRNAMTLYRCLAVDKLYLGIFHPLGAIEQQQRR